MANPMDGVIEEIRKLRENHDELLEALKKLVDLCERDDNPYSTDGKNAHPFSEIGQAQREQAIKAINKAEGGSND